MQPISTHSRAFSLLGPIGLALLLAGCGNPATSPVINTPPVVVSFSPVLLPTIPVTIPVANATPDPASSAAPAPNTFTAVLSDLPTLDGANDGITPGYRAAVMNDGRVLIVGGIDNNDAASAAAYLYLPGAQAGTALEHLTPMTTARTDFSATQLDNGDILIVGGDSESNAGDLASAEIFDPVVGGFSATGSMHAPRENQSAIKLSDGRVLIIGGEQGCFQNECKTLNSVEIYDPAKGTFSVLTNKFDGRFNAAVAELPDGNVLIAGGQDANGKVLSSTLILDPKTGAIRPSGSLSVPRVYASATRLPDGDVLIAGGFNDIDSSGTAPSAELYDMATGVFTRTGDMNTARIPAVSVLLSNGAVLVAGGTITTAASGNAEPSRAQLFNPANNTFVAAGPLPAGFDPTIGLPLPDGRVFLYGIYSGGSGNYSDGVVLYTPPTKQM